MNNKRRYKLEKKIPMLVVLLIIFLGVGYSFLTRVIDIKGTTKVMGSTFSVYFDNVEKIDGTVELNSVDIVDNTTLDFDLSLETPGDFYKFSVDVVNGGTLDVMLKSINLTGLDDNKFIKYSITWSDGTPIKSKDMISVGGKDTILINIEYSKDLTWQDINGVTADTNLNLSLTADYEMADENGLDRKASAANYIIHSANEVGVAYADGMQKEMFGYSHAATNQTPALTDYRYRGADPNNHIEFNGNTTDWRIIGVFDVEDSNGDFHKALKIMEMKVKYRGSFCGNYYAGGYCAYWPNSDARNVNSSDYAKYSDEAKSMIMQDPKIYLGSCDGYGNVDKFYSCERSNSFYTGTSGKGPYTAYTHDKVSLIYPSDFLYTKVNGETWMYTDSFQWTVTPVLDSNFRMCIVEKGGTVGNTAAYWNSPDPQHFTVVYLSDNVEIFSGNGTSDNPYKVRLKEKDLN